MGNQFLTNIRETEAIGHVVRCFENDNIIHVAGKVNPAEDIDVINTELALADLDTCERAIHRVQKKAKGGDKDAKAELAALEKCLPHLAEAGMLRSLDLTDEDKAAIRYLSFLTLKPTMYIANVNEDGLKITRIWTRFAKSPRKKVRSWFRCVPPSKLILLSWMMTSATNLWLNWVWKSRG